MAGIGIWCVPVLLLCSCAHDAEELVVPEAPVYTVVQHLAVDFRYGAHTYAIGSVYEDIAGTAFSLDTFRMLLSGVHAVNDEGDVLAEYPDAYLLVDAGNASNDFTLGDLTSDHLHEIRFNIGLVPTMNHMLPANVPPPMNSGAMFSGNTSTGYYLLEMIGRVDSNGDGNIDNTDQAFSYRCMGDELFCESAAEVHANLPEGGVLIAWLPIDMEKLMDNIDFLSTPTATDNGPLQAQLMDQLMEALEQEH